MVHKFPETQLLQFLCLMCAVYSCNVCWRITPFSRYLFGLLMRHLRGCRPTIMSKCKWLSLNGCKCNSIICNMTKFLNLCQDGSNASICLKTVIKYNNNANEQTYYIKCCGDFSFNSYDNKNCTSSTCLILDPTYVCFPV